MRNRKPRQCTVCCEDIPLGSRQRLCDTCRSTPNPRCKRCKKVKPLSRFSRDSSRPSGFFPWCMDCQNAGTQAGAFQDPTAVLTGRICPLDDVPIRGHANRRYCSNSCGDRASRLRSHYGLTVQQYRQIVEYNAGVCPICLKTPTQWHVDHDHTTGLIMGAVCSACNVGALASTYHDPEMVRRLLVFLEAGPAKSLGIKSYAPKEKESQIHRQWGHKRKKAG